MSTVKTAIQILTIIMVVAGIAFEVKTGAHLGFVLISGGALVFAISTKIKGGKR